MATTYRVERPAVGLGYRSAIAAWTRENLDRFDVLEITVDHCIHGGRARKPKSSISSAAFRSMPTASASRSGPTCRSTSPISTRSPQSSSASKAPTYSEHLAFTRVPGRDLANLLPLPKTEAVAESIVAKVRTIQSRIPVPFLLENISYAFDWPDSNLVGCRVSQPDLPRDRRRPSARYRKPLSERRQSRLRLPRIYRRAVAGAGAARFTWPAASP